VYHNYSTFSTMNKETDINLQSIVL